MEVLSIEYSFSPSAICIAGNSLSQGDEANCWDSSASWKVRYEVNLPMVQSGHCLACKAQESCKSGLNLHQVWVFFELVLAWSHSSVVILAPIWLDILADIWWMLGIVDVHWSESCSFSHLLVGEVGVYRYYIGWHVNVCVLCVLLICYVVMVSLLQGNYGSRECQVSAHDWSFPVVFELKPCGIKFMTYWTCDKFYLICSFQFCWVLVDIGSF